MDAKKYLYHWVPKDMQGENIYPLSMLKDVHPELYARKVAKYTGREQVMRWQVPSLNCLWNDVIHLSAIHPSEIKKAMREAGDTYEYDIVCYEIDPLTLDPDKATVYTYVHEPSEGEVYPEEFLPYDASKIDEYAVIPNKTKEYYKKCFAEGRVPLAMPWIPHVFYKGVISSKGAKKVVG